MSILLRCDDCCEEVPAKVAPSSYKIALPKGWEFTPVLNTTDGEEVIVSCSDDCKTRLMQVADNIRNARAERARLEKKKARKNKDMDEDDHYF